MMKKTLSGGMRLKGLSPVKEPGLPVVSVITVVYNGQNLIDKTIQSVVAQTYPNIEYIVIDGASTDGTLDVILLNEDHIHFWISEPDQGIYDAMNKGLAAATGDFVWFMNAGDQIYSPTTTEQIFSDSTTGLIYYGDTMVVDADYLEVGLRRLRPPVQLTWKSFKKGMLVCHQAILVSREIADPFDLQYHHSADFDWVIKAVKKAGGQEGKAGGQEGKKAGRKGRGHKGRPEEEGRPETGGQRAEGKGQRGVVINTHLVLCAFLDGGHSKQNIGVSLRERFRSMAHHYGWIPTALRHIPIAVRFVWYLMKNKRF